MVLLNTPGPVIIMPWYRVPNVTEDTVRVVLAMDPTNTAAGIITPVMVVDATVWDVLTVQLVPEPAIIVVPLVTPVPEMVMPGRIVPVIAPPMVKVVVEIEADAMTALPKILPVNVVDPTV